MNKKCFRVIFSKTLQRLVVTSELAKSEGKSSEASYGFSLPSLQIFAQLRPLTFSLFCALGFVAFSNNALAETLIIQADKSAPKNQQPIILQTANGLPQVNIQTPNEKGLSHNKYSKFDVDTKGAILNNSRKNSQTQQAGWVQGNPYLARGEAKVILNEVNSNDPSVLKGYVEVAGKKADVIIANPSGLHCEGCGIINSDRVTLTTGKPHIQNGNLDRFVVEKGKVKVSGKGLDNSRVDYTDILAREVKANAGIWSKKETKIITGKNTIKRSDSNKNLQIIHTTQPLAEEMKPQFAVDVGELGGMYSGKIHLIGTENGVGVRNAGHIGASAETLKIDSQGRIVNTGTLNSNQVLDLTAEKGIENKGKIENRQGNIQLTTKADIKQGGSVVARQGNIHKKAEKAITQQGETVAKGEIRYTASSVDASTSSLIAAGVNVKDSEKGEIRELESQSAQGKSIQITSSNKTTLQGKNIASGKVQVKATSVNLDKSQTSAHTIEVKASQGEIQANGATLTAQERLQLKTPKTLSTQSSHLTAKVIDTDQQSLNAKNAVWKQTGESDFRLKGDSINTAGGIFSTQGNLLVQSQQLDNAQGTLSSEKSLVLNVSEHINSTQGQLIANENLKITSGSINNDQGLIYAKQNITLNSASNISNRNTNTVEKQGIVARQTLWLNGKTIDNTQGKIASQQLTLKATQANNTEGRIQTKRRLDFNLAKLVNHQGILTSGNEARLALDQLEQGGGHIESETLSLTANRINTTNGSLIFAKHLNITTTGEVNNQDSRIVAKNEGNLTIGSHLNNGNGTIGSQMGSLTLNVVDHNMTNKQGKIVAAQQITLQSSALNNEQGFISAKNVALNVSQTINNEKTFSPANDKGIVAQTDLTIQTQNLNNDQGNVYSHQSLHLTSNKLSNHAGNLFSSKDSRLTTSALNNDKGKINVGGKLDLNAETVSQVAGLIKASVLNLVSTQISSTQQSEISGNQITVKTDTLNNNGSVLAAQQNMVVDAKKGIQNQQGTVASLEGDLSINTHQSALNNTQGIIVAQNANLQLQTGKIDNQQGSIRAKQATINTHQQTLDNSHTLANREQGIIVEDLNLTTNKLDNQQGRITATNRGDIVAQAIHNQSGEILVQHNAKVTSSEIDNQAGILASTKGDLGLTTNSVLNNQQGQISAKGNLVLDTQGLSNQYGKILSHQLTLNTHQQDINNQHGSIVAQQNGKIESGALHNQQGLIRADKQLSLNTHHQQIDNRHTQGKDQGIVSLGHIVLEAVSHLQNQAGKVYANHSLNADVQHHINNIDGLIQSNEQLTLSAKTIDNQAGNISTKAGSISAEHLNNRATSTTGSFILGDDLTLNVKHLDNQGTKAKGSVPEQGVQASNLTLNVDTLNNQQGGIYTQNSANITAKNRLDNQQGELLSGNTIEIKHDGNLMVNNRDGLIQGHKLIHLNAKGLEAEGSIKTEGDLAVSLKDSFTLNKAFEVGNNLTFKTEGDFENNVIQAVKNKAIFTANRITNNVNAEISAHETQLNSSELTNRGLIDGYKTRINSTYVTNIGTGRIYGNYLAFKAENISNLRETVNGETKSATIAAREKLDFGVGTLTNRDHSLILSLGKLNIGGDLDKDGNAIGQAKFVDNGSATIEALIDGKLSAKKVLNHDVQIQESIKETETKHLNYMREYTDSEGNKVRTEWFRHGIDGIYHRYNGHKTGHTRFIFFDKNKKTVISDGSKDSWFEQDYTRTTKTPTYSNASPAKFLIGGSLHIIGDGVMENKYSHILVGKKLKINDTDFSENKLNLSLKDERFSLINKDMERKITHLDVGKETIYGFDRRPTKAGRWRHKNFREPTSSRNMDDPSEEDIKFNLVLNTIGQKLNLNQTIDSQVVAKDVVLDTITIQTKDNLAIDTISQNNPTIKSNDSIHIVLTPSIDDKDKNKVINSGQVIGKLDTTIDGNEIKDFGNLKLPTIKTHLTDVTVPTASLYRINPDHPQGYLVETDPKFTQREQWLSSDYLLDQLRYDHNLTHKRLGDGFYEQNLINEQVNQLTGRRYIEGYSNDLAQYKALMNSGVKYAKQFNLTVGIGLTAKQMSELTTDMVWLVNKEVTLPNGRKVTALTPQVYLVARNSDITSRGAVISANEIVGNVDELKNTGVIAGRDLTRIHSTQLENRGVILGDSVDLSAKQNLVNLGGKIEAVKALSLSAGKKLDISSTLSHSKSKDGNFERTILDQIGTVRVTGQGGSLNLQSDGELTVKGAVVESEGSLRAEAKAVDITTLHIKNKEHYNGNADNYYRLDQSSEVGSQFSGKAGTVIVSENDVRLRQATMSSAEGDVTVASLNGDINIEAGRAEEQLATAVKSTSKGFLNKTTEKRRYEHHTTNAIGSELDGQNVNLIAQKGQVTIKGSSAVAEEDLTIYGKKGVAIVSDVNTHYQKEESEKSKKGLMGSGGGIGFTVGKKKEQVEADNTKERAARSQVGSLKGNTLISTEGHYQQTGSVVTSRDGDVDIFAKSAKVEAARSEYESNYKRTVEQKGVTIAVNIPAVQAVQAAEKVVKTTQKAGESKNNRINAMSSINSAWDAMRLGDQVLGMMDNIKKASSLAQGLSQGVSVSVTYGQQKQVQTQHSIGAKGESSQINAGGKVNLRAIGEGDKSTITVIGSDIGGKQGTSLKAGGNIDLLAFQQKHQDRSTNKSSGFNAGIAASYGQGTFAFGATAGANYGKGYGNGDESTWLHSHVGHKDSLTSIESGQDINMKGGQARGNRIEFSAENLNMESLQDTMKYRSKQMNAEGSATVGYGFSANGSYNQSKMNADFANVNEQTGVFAGDGGYSVNIRKHTDLKGATITSTEKAEMLGNNQFGTDTLTHQDIQNQSSYSAKGFGLDGGFSVGGGKSPQKIGDMELQQIGNNHKDGSSKVELNGIAGVASQGNWGIAKGLATTFLGQVSDSSRESGITTSAINTTNIHIRDSEAQQELTGRTAEEVAKAINKTNIHQTVTKTNVEQVRADLDRDLATATDFVKKLNKVGDDIYNNIEKSEGNIFVKEKREANCESIECIQYRELDTNSLQVPKTKEEAEALSRMYAHGIMNMNDNERLQGSIQYGGKDYLENDVLVVRKPFTSVQSELTYTVFERLRAGLDMPRIFGASNASREQAKVWGLLEEYNRKNPDNQIELKHLSHSLGVSSTKNAMNWASYKGMQLDNTTLEANTVGTSYPMTNKTIGGKLSLGLYDKGYTEKASGVFRDGKVSYAVAPRDIVGTGVQLPWVPGAFSLGIGNTNTTGSNTTGIPLWGIFAGDHTKAYYKDSTVINFLNTGDKEKERKIIKDYQYKIWGDIGPKTESINLNKDKDGK